MSSRSPSPFNTHDHAKCISASLAEAETVLAHQGARLTPVRRRTLEILLEEHRPLGAYDMLERLGAEGFGHQPPVAYRALEFLVDHGLAHRIRRLNAFAACMHPGITHTPAFFICRKCDRIAETQPDMLHHALVHTAQDMGFLIERQNIEILGLCAPCQNISGQTQP